MKDLENPPAIVAQAQVECDAIAELGKKISASYKRGVELRKQLNGVGINIGRAIIEACRDKEVVGKVAALNDKSSKPRGGTDTRAHSWVADRLAELHGYNADYLKQCARQYLAGCNKHLEQNRQPIIEYQKGGNLKIEIKELPEIKAEPPLVEAPKAPRIDSLFDDGEKPAAQKLPTTEEEGLELAKAILTRAGLDERINPPVIKGLILGLQPILDSNGFVIQYKPPVKKGGKE